jgi:hypothetical protein
MDPMGRDDRVYEEAVALWRQLYRDPPPKARGAEILGMIVGGLADADYNRLQTPHLRPSNITFPK